MPTIDPIDETLKSLQGIHLWHAGMSSCSQRVRITLAEKDLEFTSHLIDLHAGENASEDYQRIHPKGLVPAMVIDGELIIESVDIIDELDKRFGGATLRPADTDAERQMMELMQRANDAQSTLKLLTFEFLFRAAPPPPTEKLIAFQKTHKNEALKQFHRDFAAGFARERIEEAVAHSHADYSYLNSLLGDGRTYLGGDEFTLADVAWMPNFHRFELIGWPWARYANLASWFECVSARPSYRVGLVDWEPTKLLGLVESGLATRIQSGDGVEKYLRNAP